VKVDCIYFFAAGAYRFCTYVFCCPDLLTNFYRVPIYNTPK
jgi:hypothetical protein